MKSISLQLNLTPFHKTPPKENDWKKSSYCLEEKKSGYSEEEKRKSRLNEEEKRILEVVCKRNPHKFASVLDFCLFEANLELKEIALGK